MINNRFIEKFNAITERNSSFLCVGLDTDYEKIPQHLKKKNRPKSIFKFNKIIVDATKDLVCCYKLNSAFYEAEGSDGIKILKETVKYIGGNVPIIIDAKRGDIGNSSKMYCRFVFEYLDADAVTVMPYMGYDSMKPFIDYTERFVFPVVLSSNKGALDFQYYVSKGKPLYREVIDKIKDNENVGFVFGATKPEDIKNIRDAGINNMLLIPGIGSQGGDLEKSVKFAFMNSSKALFNVSRSIIYSGSGKNFAYSVRSTAEKYKNMIISHIEV